MTTPGKAFRARVLTAHPDRGGEGSDVHPALRGVRPDHGGSGSTYEPGAGDESAREPSPRSNSTAPRPPDPDGDLDRSLHEDSLRDKRAPKPPDPTVAREAYLTWLGRVSAHSSAEIPGGNGDAPATLGTVLLLQTVLSFPAGLLLAGGLAILYSANDIHQNEETFEVLATIVTIIYYLCLFTFCCWIVRKYCDT